jgi:bacterial/archaeal transporter family-2 protein
MQAALIFVVIGVIGGIAVGLQGPLASLIGQRLGLLESVFIVHLGGLVAAGVPLLLRRGGALASWHTLPWYALIAGVFGLVVLGAVNLTIPRLGTTATVVLIVVGQLIIGLVIDQFGLLSTTARPIDLARIIGLLLLFAGTYLIVR